MKKLWIGLMAAVMLALLALPAFAQAQAGDNFKKAGQQVLAKEEKGLSDFRVLIDSRVLDMAQDRVIEEAEMGELDRYVRMFYQAKRGSDKYLKFYNLETSTELDQGLVRMVMEYNAQVSFFNKDRYGQVKKFFVRRTGYDVVIKTGTKLNLTNSLFLIVTAVLLFFAIYLFCLKSQSLHLVGVICFASAVMLLTLLFLA